MLDARGNGVPLDLRPGEQAAGLRVPAWLAALPEKPGPVVADKAYDPNAVLECVAAPQAEPVIPPKSNRLVPREYDENLSDARHKIEPCFGRFRQARAFAPRFAKTACSF